MAATEAELAAQLKRLSEELDRRAAIARELDAYYDGYPPLPPLVQEQKVTRAYRTLMRLSRGNWPKLIVDATEARLEVQGVRFGDQAADDDVWSIWQENCLDAESSILHQAALTGPRAYAIVWGDGQVTPRPVITLEHASMCVVEYEPGSRRVRRAALRRWRDESGWYANLYRPDGIYKFAAKAQGDAAPDAEAWKRRDVPDEQWPLANPLQTVPVVEFAVNRTLRVTPFGTGCGEFQSHLRHVDRINYKVFCGLVALTWTGFPLRVLIGDPILRDDEGNPIAPLDLVASAVGQIENPEGKLTQVPGANIETFSPEMDIRHLAAMTHTPAHYLLAELVNLSADAIRAAEAALVAKVRRHMRALGESWEEVARLSLRVIDPGDPRGLDANAQIIWADPESRSMAERADAATKLAQILPWQALAQSVLGATPQEISRWESQRASDGLGALLAAATSGAPAGGVG